jgi:multidrug efflux pump subunit AcrB
VSDVARVARTTEDKGMRVHGNGEPGVSLVVRKRASADIIRVVDALRARLQTYTPPDGVTVRVFNDSSELARDRLEIVSTNGFGGIALVILVLVVFLTRRIAFWVAFGIPFAMFGVLAILPLFHITVNMVSMAAFVLVIGLIVDDAIVVAERIAFYRERGLSPRDAGVEGTREMSVPVIASSLTTIMAFSPMFALGGVSGRFSWAIPTVVILALSVSLFECFFLLPAHVSGDHQHKKHAGGSSDEKAEWMVRLEAAYQRFLKALLPFRIPFVIGFALLFVGSGVLARSCMALTLFPQDDAKGLYVKVEMPLGTPLEKTEAAIGYLEQQIPTLLGEDFDGMTARIGHKVPQIAKSRGDAENEALLTVYLVDDRHLPALTWVDRLKRDLKPPSGATLLFEHIPIGPPVGRPVTVHISSPDDGLRREGVRHVVSTLSTLEGVGDIETDENEGLRQIDLRPDFQRLAQRGVDVETVTRAVKAAFFGLPVTETRKSDETTTIRVRFDTPARRDLADLLDMQVRARDGMPVPLRDLLDPEERPSVARIHHRDGVRATTVTASVDVSKGQTASGVARVLRGSVLPKYESMPGIRISLGGEAKATEKTLGEMPQVGLLALIGMLMVVTLLFGSVLQAIFIVIAVPLGYVGVIWTFFAHQMPLSFFAILGAVGLSGVVVNDSIVMVSTLSPRIGEGLDGIVEAAADRLRPVLLTTLTTVVGVMPTAYGLGGRDALLSPMSLALGWGLVFATVITLLLVPALFMVRLDVEGWLSSRLGRDAARAPETAPAPSAAPANVDKVQPRDAAE